MYPSYFGLREPSFSITPDPQYLFLGAQHREALAHLLYGASEHGGFVLLTGEVGTGKTTVCRAFLEQLPDGVEVALVLNPALTAQELIAAIHDEFRIPYPPEPPDAGSAKALLDRLNHYLLDCHARGRRPVLIIDEAQNLSPQVLEQVRLLTNLETHKHKLLQIFLIGQPELRALLASANLRQLNQRITARFHLLPLRRAETVAYIRHRLAVAGVERPLFTRSALHAVHRASGGVPRLINLICDRALLGAAVQHRLLVDTGIARRAAREVLGEMRGTAPTRRSPLLAIGVAALLAGGLGWWLGATGWIPWRLSPDSGWLLASPPTEATANKQGDDHGAGGENETVAPPVSPWPSPEALAAAPLLEPRDPAAWAELLLEQDAALGLLARAWGLLAEQASDPAPALPADCAAVEALGLGCEQEIGRWSDLRRFDRPAVLHLALPDGSAGTLALLALDEEYALVGHAGGLARLPIAALDTYWSGEYLLLWRSPPVGGKLIGRNASGEAVRWLRERLAQWPDSGLTAMSEPRYDETLLAAVRRFQAAHGLAEDGIAGPHTLILLANVLGEDRPQLHAPD